MLVPSREDPGPRTSASATSCPTVSALQSLPIGYSCQLVNALHTSIAVFWFSQQCLCWFVGELFLKYAPDRVSMHTVSKADLQGTDVSLKLQLYLPLK